MTDHIHQPVIIIGTTDDPDLLASMTGDEAWDLFTQLAEIEFRRLMKTDPKFRSYMAAAIAETLVEQDTPVA